MASYVIDRQIKFFSYIDDVKPQKDIDGRNMLILKSSPSDPLQFYAVIRCEKYSRQELGGEALTLAVARRGGADTKIAEISGNPCISISANTEGHVKVLCAVIQLSDTESVNITAAFNKKGRSVESCCMRLWQLIEGVNISNKATSISSESLYSAIETLEGGQEEKLRRRENIKQLQKESHCQQFKRREELKELFATLPDSPAEDFEIKDGCISKYKGNEKQVKIPRGIKEISADAFKESKIEQLYIPGSVKTIGSDAFSFCAGLKDLYLEEGIAEILNSCFYGCASLEEVYIPDTVREIKFMAFEYCDKLNFVRLPTELSVISSACFMNCTALSEILLPADLCEIENEAFKNCTSLENIDLPEDLETIEVNAFRGCSSLKRPDIPAFCEVAPSAFWGCRKK